VLAAVKTEFGKFGGILDKVSKTLQETQNVVGRRRRAMDRKLQGVELVPEIEAVAVLELGGTDELAEEPERYAAE
jgi:DNA recombination protein RmuC